MLVQKRLHDFANSITHFAREQRGNVAVIFGLSLIPIMTSVGMAVDYSHANSVKTSLQGALDATALMLAKSATSQTSAQMQALGNKYFKANFNRDEAINVKIDVAYTQNSSTIQVNGNASIKTNFLGLIGIKKLTVGGTSTAGWGKQTRLRVALVLDNTGSMSSAGKMSAMQTAAKNLITRLSSASTATGDVYISIIPFATDVNVGPGSYAANWLDWYDWDANNGSDVTKTTCTQQWVGKNGRYAQKCSTSTTWVANSHTTWNGCVTDRDQSYDVLSTPPNPADAKLPVTSASTLFPADQDANCPVALKPLSYDWAAMRTLVDSMSPAGTTNQGIGLAWGWLSLTPGSVLNPPAKDPNYAYADHIVLLSDGLNTANRWYDDQASIDARQKILCQNVKAAGITLWTIQVNTDKDPTSTLLQQCASDPAKFFLLTSAKDIISAFDDISFKITRLHLAK